MYRIFQSPVETKEISLRIEVAVQLVLELISYSQTSSEVFELTSLAVRRNVDQVTSYDFHILLTLFLERNFWIIADAKKFTEVN